MVWCFESILFFIAYYGLNATKAWLWSQKCPSYEYHIIVCAVLGTLSDIIHYGYFGQKR